jgi:YVTN family beta-propeller protein
LELAKDWTPRDERGESAKSTPARLCKVVTSLLAGALTLAVAGCGDTFRPPVASISPVGPAAQPSKYAVAISDPGNGNPGLFTMVDFSGDTVLNTTAIGVAPQYLILGFSGTEAYVLNKNGSINSFGVSSYLQSNQVQTSTLFAGANATSIFPSGSYTYITEPYTAGNARIAVAQGSPPSVKQELAVGDNPVFVAATQGSSRIYAISQAANQVTAIQTQTNTISNTITVGRGPVYGVMTQDNNRAFILNQTDGTVSVINVNSNQLDSAGGAYTNPIPVGAGPVWADLYYPGSLLVTANAAGNSISVVSIPLCSIVALPTNPNCDASNPTDATGFGTVLATVPVGVDPQMVSILQDGSRAYVANTNSGSATGGSVSVVSLDTFTVTKTIPFDGNTTNQDGSTNLNHGPLCHPNFIATAVGTPTGKVYVTCADGRFMTVLETDTDSVRTTIDLQGLAVQMRVTAQ